MDQRAYDRLVEQVTWRGDLQAAQALYIEAGRRHDWERGLLAASLLYGARPITPDSWVERSGENYDVVTQVTDCVQGVSSLGRIIVAFNRHLLEAQHDWADAEGWYTVAWALDFAPLATLKRAADLFRDVGWEVAVEPYKNAASVLWRLPGSPT